MKNPTTADLAQEGVRYYTSILSSLGPCHPPQLCHPSQIACSPISSFFYPPLTGSQTLPARSPVPCGASIGASPPRSLRPSLVPLHETPGGRNRHQSRNPWLSRLKSLVPVDACLARPVPVRVVGLCAYQTRSGTRKRKSWSGQNTTLEHICQRDAP